jgi:hypothetical protein
MSAGEGAFGATSKERVAGQHYPAHCCVRGCSVHLPAGRWMCVRCWRSVPLELRERVWASWRAKTEPVGNTGEDAEAYAEACRIAIEAVAKP